MRSRSPHRLSSPAVPSHVSDAAGMPEDVDVWQAAALFVGLYGPRALHVAAARMAELDEAAARDRQVWNRIIIRIGELLCGSPSAGRN